MSSSSHWNSFVCEVFSIFLHNIIVLCYFVSEYVKSDHSYYDYIIRIDSIGVNLLCFIVTIEIYGVCVNLLNFVLIIS